MCLKVKEIFPLYDYGNLNLKFLLAYPHTTCPDLSSQTNDNCHDRLIFLFLKNFLN